MKQLWLIGVTLLISCSVRATGRLGTYSYLGIGSAPVQSLTLQAKQRCSLTCGAKSFGGTFKIHKNKVIIIVGLAKREITGHFKGEDIVIEKGVEESGIFTPKGLRLKRMPP